MGPIWRAGRRLGALVLATLCCAASLAPAPAGAHAQLIAIEPAAGAALDAAPAAVRLEFNEPVAPLVLRWVAPDGAVAEVAGRVAGATVVVTPPALLATGAHVLNWRVVSLDGHPIAGAHVVSVGAPGGAAVALPQPGQGPARLAAASRLALTLALVFGVGGAVYLRLVRPAASADAWHLALAAALAATPAAALALGAQGLDLLGLPPRALLGPAPWSAALETRFAATAALGGLAGLVAAGGLIWGGRVASALAWALAAASFATAGHAAQAPPVWLTAPAVAMHGAAAVFWIGAVPQLLAQAVATGESLAPRSAPFRGRRFRRSGCSS